MKNDYRSESFKRERFINKAVTIHGDKYDYSLVNYVNSHTKIKIICKAHGEFEQLPCNHIKGKKCVKCVVRKRYSTEEFIEKSVKKHGDKYDYSLTNYISNKDKVEIICKIHGVFKQSPSSHLHGSGCYACSNNTKLTNAEYITEARKVHGDLYNYDDVNYINKHKPIKIICKIHGEFEQTPRLHLISNGCTACSGTKKSTTDEFIIKANKIHNNLYNYDEVVYVNAHVKIEIKCYTHGSFIQKPNNHLNGDGCLKCHASKGEIKIENLLKENNINYKSQYTFNDLKYKKLLKFDFGITDENGNLKYLIEYNGVQHYIFNKRFHRSQEGFKITQYRDKLKIDYCNINNILLHIIRYDEDVTEKVQKIISNYKLY